MRTPWLILLPIGFSVFLVCACSGRNGEDMARYLPGDWTCNVEEGSFVGVDTLILSTDSTFSENKGLLYTSSDSGFDFSVIVRVHIKGGWNLSGDTLALRYTPTTLSISTDADSFHLSASGNNADASKLSGLSEVMYKDLDEYLSSALIAKYSSMWNKEFTLGRIEHIDTDNLILETGRQRIVLKRCGR